MRPRVLCISLGSIGQRHLRNIRTLLPDARIGVFRQHTQASPLVPDGADDVFASMDDAVAFDPHAVFISSPASEHCANAAPFLARNLPIFIEKPLAASLADTQAFATAARLSTGFVMVGYVLRFLPALHAIRDAVRDGMLGQVYTAHIEVGQYLPDWRPDADYRAGVSGQSRLGGGALLELSHEIDYATWLFGQPCALQCSSARLSTLDIDVEDSAELILEYPHQRVTVSVDFLQRVADMAVKIVGEKATLKADLIHEAISIVSPEHPKGIDLVHGKLPNGNDIYLRQFDFFLSRALPAYQPVYPDTPQFSDWANVDEALNVLRLVDLAKQANRTGQRQTLANETGEQR